MIWEGMKRKCLWDGLNVNEVPACTDWTESDGS